MRHSALGALDDNAANRHRHAMEIGIDPALHRGADEVERHRSLRQTKIDGRRRNQQNGQNRHDAVGGNLNEPPHRVPVPLLGIRPSSAISTAGAQHAIGQFVLIATKDGLKRGQPLPLASRSGDSGLSDGTASTPRQPVAADRAPANSPRPIRHDIIPHWEYLDLVIPPHRAKRGRPQDVFPQAEDRRQR